MSLVAQAQAREEEASLGQKIMVVLESWVLKICIYL
jgi:hypothetical protein